jgi:hypothetical protein
MIFDKSDGTSLFVGGYEFEGDDYDDDTYSFIARVQGSSPQWGREYSYGSTNRYYIPTRMHYY